MNVKTSNMKKLQFSLQPWLEKLDRQWRQLPGKRRRRIVLYSFALYALLTVAVVLQAFLTTGNKRAPLPIGHITNPVIRSLEKPNLKIENNERN